MSSSGWSPLTRGRSDILVFLSKETKVSLFHLLDVLAGRIAKTTFIVMEEITSKVVGDGARSLQVQYTHLLTNTTQILDRICDVTPMTD